MQQMFNKNQPFFANLLQKQNGDWRDVRRSILCRSRPEFSNEYVVCTYKIWLRYSRERALWSFPALRVRLCGRRPSAPSAVRHLHSRSPGRSSGSLSGEENDLKSRLVIPHFFMPDLAKWISQFSKNFNWKISSPFLARGMQQCTQLV